jgi:hypothetical protein
MIRAQSPEPNNASWAQTEEKRRAALEMMALLKGQIAQLQERHSLLEGFSDLQSLFDQAIAAEVALNVALEGLIAAESDGQSIDER